MVIKLWAAPPTSEPFSLPATAKSKSLAMLPALMR